MFRFVFIPFFILFMHTASAANILIWGDSLSAGYGIAQENAWPQLLQNKLRQEGFRQHVINASISGETSAGGRSRLPVELARSKPSIVILALGANDGLRGLPIKTLKTNLEQMIKASQAAGAKVLLVGMRMPPNLGPVYTRQFEAVYPQLAQTYKTALLPFLLNGIAEQRSLFQADNLHPTAQAQPYILESLWPQLKTLLRK